MKITRTIFGQQIDIYLTEEEVKRIKNEKSEVAFLITVHETNSADFVVFGKNAEDAKQKFTEWWDNENAQELVCEDLAGGYCGAEIDSDNIRPANRNEIESADIRHRLIQTGKEYHT